MKPVNGTKVLDLGGQPTIWDLVEIPLVITCINLPGISMVDYHTHHHITYVEGDACHLPNFKFGDFDIVFSNSVIEHVGNSDKQMQFAHEVMRLSNNYWIQTPCKQFPIEVHSGMPFWWYYPSGLRTYFLDQWSKKTSWLDRDGRKHYRYPQKGSQKNATQCSNFHRMVHFS